MGEGEFDAGLLGEQGQACLLFCFYLLRLSAGTLLLARHCTPHNLSARMLTVQDVEPLFMNDEWQGRVTDNWLHSTLHCNNTVRLGTYHPQGVKG